jgi:hypothetical protein
VDGTGSGSCPVAGFGISGVEPSGFTVTELVRSRRTRFVVYLLVTHFSPLLRKCKAN